MARKKNGASAGSAAQRRALPTTRMTDKDRREIIFLALIFIGIGLGGAINQAGAGLILGVGLGIYGSGLLKDMNTGKLRAPLNRPTYVAILLLFYLVALILTFVYSAKYPSPYNSSILLLVLGGVLLYLAARSASRIT